MFHNTCMSNFFYKFTHSLISGLSDVKTVGILLPNCIEYIVTVAGCMHAGLTVTTVNAA